MRPPDWEALAAALRKSLKDPATLKQAREHVQEHYGRVLDTDDPAWDIIDICLDRSVKFANAARSSGSQPADVPAAVRELRQALDLIQKWTGRDSAGNKKLRATVEKIERTGDPVKAHDLLRALWKPMPGPTTTSHFAALADELRATLTAAGLKSVPGYTAFLIDAGYGDGEWVAGLCAGLNEQIAAVEAELAPLESQEKVIWPIWDRWANVPEAHGKVPPGFKDRAYLAILNDGEQYDQWQDGAPAKLDDLRRKRDDLRARRAALLRWVPLAAGSIKKAAGRKK